MNTNFILSSALIIILGGIGGYIDYSNTQQREESHKTRQLEEKYETKELIAYYEANENKIVRIDSLYKTLLQDEKFTPTVNHASQDDMISSYLTNLIKSKGDSTEIANAIKEKKALFKIKEEETIIRYVKPDQYNNTFSIYDHYASEALDFKIQNGNWNFNSDSVIYQADDILKGFKRIEGLKYVAVCHTTDEAHPKISTETFESGVRLSNIYLYDITNGALLGERSIYAMNEKEEVNDGGVLDAKYQLTMELTTNHMVALNKALFHTPFIKK